MRLDGAIVDVGDPVYDSYFGDGCVHSLTADDQAVVTFGSRMFTYDEHPNGGGASPTLVPARRRPRSTAGRRARSRFSDKVSTQHPKTSWCNAVPYLTDPQGRKTEATN
jgi:hypothetical protein